MIAGFTDCNVKVVFRSIDGLTKVVCDLTGFDRDVDSPGCTGALVCMQHLLHTGMLYHFSY